MDTTHFNNNDKVPLKILINILLSVALKIHSSTPLSAEIVGLTQAVLSLAEHSMLLHFPVLTRDKRAFLEVQVGQELPGPVLIGELHREPLSGARYSYFYPAPPSSMSSFSSA